MARSLARELRTRGVEVITAAGEQMSGRTDLSQLEFAKSLGLVLVTSNVKDYYRLHMDYMASGRDHAGMILIRQQKYSVGEQLRRVLKLVSTLSAEEMKNRAEFLTYWH